MMLQQAPLFSSMRQCWTCRNVREILRWLPVQLAPSFCRTFATAAATAQNKKRPNRSFGNPSRQSTRSPSAPIPTESSNTPNADAATSFQQRVYALWFRDFQVGVAPPPVSERLWFAPLPYSCRHHSDTPPTQPKISPLYPAYSPVLASSHSLASHPRLDARILRSEFTHDINSFMEEKETDTPGPYTALESTPEGALTLTIFFSYILPRMQSMDEIDAAISKSLQLPKTDAQPLISSSIIGSVSEPNIIPSISNIEKDVVASIEHSISKSNSLPYRPGFDENYELLLRSISYYCDINSAANFYPTALDPVETLFLYLPNLWLEDIAAVMEVEKYLEDLIRLSSTTHVAPTALASTSSLSGIAEQPFHPPETHTSASTRPTYSLHIYDSFFRRVMQYVKLHRQALEECGRYPWMIFREPTSAERAWMRENVPNYSTRRS